MLHQTMYMCFIVGALLLLVIILWLINWKLKGMMHSNNDHNTDFPCLFKTDKGLNKHIVIQISEQKNEPGWMTDFRLSALEIFEQKPMPSWGADLKDLDPYDIFYYIKPIEQQHTQWDDVPEKIKYTF